MHRIIAIIAVCAASLGFNPAMAGEETGRDAVRIEADQEAKAFVFIIDDEPVALLDAHGLHVRNAIVYGDTLTDAGTLSFDKRMEELGKEAADD